MNEPHFNRVQKAPLYTSAGSQRFSSLLFGVIIACAMAATACGPGNAAGSPPEATATDAVSQALAPSVSNAQMTVDSTALSQEELSQPATTNPQLVSMPCGSYVLTCWNFYVADNYFSATCRTKSGGSRWSSITRSQCPGWALWNDNGVLRCGSKC